MDGRYEPREVFVPDGQYLRASRGSDGAERALLFDALTNKLLGPPELFPAEPESKKSISGTASSTRWSVASNEMVSELLVVALVAAGGAVIEVARPLVAAWWTEKAWPSLKTKVSRRGGAQPLVTAEADAVAMAHSKSSGGAASDDSSGETGVVRDERIPLSAEEVQARRVAMLTALAFLADQWRVLSNAREEASTAVGAFSSQQMTAAINSVLEAGAPLIDKETSDELVRILGSEHIKDGRYVSDDPASSAAPEVPLDETSDGDEQIRG